MGTRLHAVKWQQNASLIPTPTPLCTLLDNMSLFHFLRMVKKMGGLLARLIDCVIDSRLISSVKMGGTVREEQHVVPLRHSNRWGLHPSFQSHYRS